MSLTRKSPYRHPVRQHKKSNGTVVHKYERGKGKKAEPPRKVIAAVPTRKTSRFTVTVNDQTYRINEDSIPAAIEAALQKYPGTPKVIKVRGVS